MSNLDDVESKYVALLRKLDNLRTKGFKDTDSEIIKTKIALRELLDLKKKNSTAIQKVVPRLTGIKTISLRDTSTDVSMHNLAGISAEILSNKYVILGVAIGIIAILYLYFKSADEHKLARPLAT